MQDKIYFKIKDFGPINEANIDIGKINVVGGHNSTGKSSASKLLYCFLRSSFSNRGDFAYEKIKNQIKHFIQNIYGKYGLIRPEYVDLKDLNNPKLDFFKIYNDNEKYLERHFDDLSILEKYYQAKLDYSKLNTNAPFRRFIKQDMEEIDEILDIISENGNHLCLSILRTSLYAEFASKEFNFNSLFEGTKNNVEFSFSLNFKEHNFQSDESFISRGSFEIEDVFYIDSFSFFETSKPWRDTNSHVGYLRKMLNDSPNENQDLFDETVNKNIISIEDEIKNIIHGEMVIEKGRFYYTTEDNKLIDMQNTASGIKQIGMIQLLLANRHLKEDCFLIIDEPEVNLHPEWQIKLAEILVMLAKKLDVYIYINTHSPMFIESMTLYSEFYDLLDDTNVYLTEKHKLGGYTFKKIDPKDMGAVYENLSRPYDDLDEIKAKILLRK